MIGFILRRSFGLNEVPPPPWRPACTARVFIDPFGGTAFDKMNPICPNCGWRHVPTT